MRIARRISLKGIDLLALLTFCIAFLEVPYLNYIYNLQSIKTAAIGITILCELFCVIKQKMVVKTEHFLLLIDAIFVVIVTMLYNGSLIQCVKDFSAAIVTCLLIIICRGKRDLKRVLKIWCFGLLFLTIIDTATMIIWPKGLYSSTFVHNNWFLGYKTNRLKYTFSLLVFFMYSELLNGEVLSKFSFFLAIIVSVNAFMSRGSGSAIAVVAYSGFMYILFGKKRKKFNKKIIDKSRALFNNHVLLFSIWAIAFCMLVLFQNQTFFNKIIVGIFNKAYSFNERRTAWANTLREISNHWLIGAGVQSRTQTLQLFEGFSNAHNTLFTYLHTGGIIGLSILIIVYISILKKTSLSSSNYAVTVYFYCTLFLGLTSSALAFCSFFFAILMLPLNKHLSDKDFA